MAVNVSGGALGFEAFIDDDKFEATIANIKKSLQGITAESLKQAGAIDAVGKASATTASSQAAKIISTEKGLRDIGATAAKEAASVENVLRAAVGLSAGQSVQIDKTKRSLESIGQTAKAGSDDLEGLAKKASLAIGTYLSFAAAGSFLQDVVKVRGEFQQLSVAFETFLQSKQKADALMSQAVKLAAVTPFTLQEVGTGAKQLLAYGFAADQVIDNLEKLGNVASGVGAPLGDIVYTYGTLKAQGRAYAQDIRQFSGRGIPIIAELAKQFKVSETEVNKLVEAGKVGFPEIEKAFNSMTGAGGLFFNLMQEQSKTLTGQLSNLNDAWSRMLNDIGQKNEGVFASALSGAISVVDNYEKVVDLLELIIIGYGSYRAAVALTTLAQVGLTAAELLQYGALELVRKSQIALNLAMAASPVAAFTLVLSALTAVVVGLNSTIDGAVESQKNLINISAEGAKSVDQARAKSEQYISVLKDETATHEQKVNALKKLREATKDHLKAYTDEEIASGKAKTGIEEYIKAIESLSIAKAANAKIDLLRGDLVDLKTKGADALGTFEKLGLTFKAFIGLGDYKTTGYIDQLLYGDKQNQALVDGKTAAIEKQITDIGNTYKKQISDALKADLTTGNDDGAAKVRASSLKAIDDLIVKKKEEQALNSTTSKEYIQFQKEINKLEAEAKAIRGDSKKQIESNENKLQAILEKRKKILEDIADLERDSKQSGLLKDQSAIDKVNEKYEGLFKTIEEFNKTHSQKVPQSAINSLTQAQREQVTNLTAKEQADKYKEAIESQKVYFDDFVQYQKDQLGDKAQDLYQTQLQGFKTYVDFLKAELTKIDGKTDIGSEQSKSFLSKTIVEEQAKDRQAAIKKEIEDYQSLIDLSQSFNLKRAAVDAKYNKLFVTLEKNRTQFSLSQYAEREKALQDSKKNELDVITKNEIEKSEAYLKFSKGLDNLGVSATRGILKGLKDLREQMKGMGLDVKALDGIIDTTALALNEKSVSGIKDAAKILRSSFQDLNIQVAGQLKLTTESLSQALDNIGTLFSSKSSKADQVGSIIGLVTFLVTSARDALLTAEDLADPLQAQIDAYTAIQLRVESTNMLLERQKKILDDLSGLEKQQASQNYLGDLEKRQKDTLKSLKDFQLDLIKSSREGYIDPVFGASPSTQGLTGLAVTLLTLGTAKKKIRYEFEAVDTSQFNTIEDFAALLQKIKEGGGKLNGKVVVEDDIKSLQLLIDTYDKTVEEQKAFRLQFMQIVTGTTSASITDSIVDGFRNGLRSAQDFGDSFREIMSNAILQSLKTSALEEPLKDFYEEFAKASASDNILTGDEIRQLKTEYEKIIASAGKSFDQLQQVSGVNLNSNTSGAQTNSLKGGFATMTEDTGNILAGQFGAVRITAGEQLAISGQQLNILNSIQSNTAYLVTHLPDINRILKSIELNGLKVK